jgi:uncharacterized membrane protein YgcG
VRDFEGDFTLTEIKSLERLIMDFEKKTSIEIAVITIPKWAVSKVDFKSYLRKYPVHERSVKRRKIYRFS